MSTTTVQGYSLRLSDYELARYRAMAARAREFEEAAWALAGIVPGARVADVGCGPGIMLAELARAIGPTGSIVGVDRSEEARIAARALIEAEGLANATVVEGTADDTNLERGTFDVVNQRHVLVHNGGREQAIVDHLASLLRPGGSIYLVEADLDGVRRQNTIPDLEGLWEKWRELMRLLGNDFRVGSKLDDLVRRAGLEITAVDARFDIVEATTDVRPPSWAARDMIVEAGLADEDDVARWDAAFDCALSAPNRPVAYVPLFSVTARRPL